eukprot:356391-Chlamydomonas_euryale.AAC.1
MPALAFDPLPGVAVPSALLSMCPFMNLFACHSKDSSDHPLSLNVLLRPSESASWHVPPPFPQYLRLCVLPSALHGTPSP